MSLCSFEITALYLGAACCLLDENCSLLLNWNILTLPFGRYLTAKMAAVHEGTLRMRKSRPDHCKSGEKCCPKANSFQTQGNFTYFYVFYVK